MRHIVFLALAFVSFVLLAPSIQACPPEIEKLPVLSQGRVAPLKIHAQKILRFISGQKSFGEFSATELYCRMSLASFSNQEQPELTSLPILVEHTRSKEFLGLKNNEHSLSLEQAFFRLSDLESFAAITKEREGESVFWKDLKSIIGRTQNYQSILAGTDWKFPVTLKDHAHAEKTASDDLQWLTLVDLKQIFPQQANSPQAALALVMTAGDKYTATNSKHLLELTYHKLHLFGLAILVSLAALAVSLVTKRTTHPALMTLMIIVLLLETVAIWFRVTISGRAPVTNMYETVMWVGLGSLAFAMILGMLRQKKLFYQAGLGLNIICLFMMMFANKMLDPSIQPLVPVLRDNFWLSTHVTTITISYAALALSWFVANTYMVRGLIFPKLQNDTKEMASLAYDAIKLGVVLLAAGIILGGVWADYSWGRFWGWDPKETWSLIALMVYMAVLHGRYAGWITEARFLPCVALSFLSVIMAWFGVNYILASGLHSYGFSNGGAVFITTVVILQLSIFVLYIVKNKSQIMSR